MSEINQNKHSAALKRLFREEFSRWKRQHNTNLEELAQRCGVSASYLSQIARNGRVPGKPVLYLLALNLDMEQPQKLIDAAGYQQEWPYAHRLTLHKKDLEQHGFLNFSIDMQGFTSVIREIVRKEVKPKTVNDLTDGRPLKVGLNTFQQWKFPNPEGGAYTSDGFFAELFELLGIALRTQFDITRYDVTPTEMDSCRDRLKKGTLDIYGPIFVLPNRLVGLSYITPFGQIGISALARKRQHGLLRPLSPPQSIDELRDSRYELAILRGSIGHHFANTRLHRSDDSLILCDTNEEAVERTILSQIKRPADVAIVQSLYARQSHSEHEEDFFLLFANSGTLLERYDDSIAVRPDWPELVTLLNEAMRYLIKNGTLADLFKRWFPTELIGDVVFPTPAEAL